MNNIIRYNSTDKDIAAVKCYVREQLNGSPLYRDEAKTELIPKEEAIELFNKGLIVVEYGSEDDGLLIAKPIFITASEIDIDGVNYDEEAGYGVIFFMPNDNEGFSLRQLYMNIGDAGPYGALYYEPDLTTPVSFADAVEHVEKGNAIVYAHDGGSVIFAAKPTCILRGNYADEYTYEVRFPIH